MKNKLLLLETEMLGPGGHYLDNVIESFYYFKKNLNVQCLLNKNFNSEWNIYSRRFKNYKKFNSNIFEKKHNKFFYLSFEIYSLIKRIILTILLIPFFLFHKKLTNYFNALNFK